MNNKLFVSNISWSTKNEQLAELFGECGTVEEAIIINDRETGRPRGFGFVTFSSDEEATAAIEKFNGFEFDGRELRVNVAQAKD